MTLRVHLLPFPKQKSEIKNIFKTKGKKHCRENKSSYAWATVWFIWWNFKIQRIEMTDACQTYFNAHSLHQLLPTKFTVQFSCSVMSITLCCFVPTSFFSLFLLGRRKKVGTKQHNIIAVGPKPLCCLSLQKGLLTPLSLGSPSSLWISVHVWTPHLVW